MCIRMMQSLTPSALKLLSHLFPAHLAPRPDISAVACPLGVQQAHEMGIPWFDEQGAAISYQRLVEILGGYLQHRFPDPGSTCVELNVATEFALLI